MTSESVPFRYCLVAATCALALRIGFFEWQILTALIMPNHDMLQGAGFFAVNLHSIRLSGEIAWWKANGWNGYAQYYQTFLSPLAPTPSHASFFAAVGAMKLFDLFRLPVSEYVMYLSVTYVVLPWCTFLAFGWLTSLFVTHPLAILFACVVYALSTIGLWEGAWIYFQEPATFTFLLAATIALIQQPSRKRVAIFLIAFLLQAASLNYWTVYNAWFAILTVGGYVCFFPSRARDALKALWSFPRLATAFTIAVAGIWAGLLGSMTIEQSGQYVRPAAGGERFAVADAVNRINYYPPHRALPGLVMRNTAWEPLDAEAPHDNPMHRARYIGLITVLLAGAALVLRRDRVVLWLLLVGATIAWTAFAPQPLVWLWTHFPLMTHVRHVFYFYPHFLAQVLLLLAAIGLDCILRLGPRWRAAAFACIIVSTVDLSLYFRGVSELDRSFTERKLWGQYFSMTPERRATLLAPMQPFSAADGFEGGAAKALPVVTQVFPLNRFVLKAEVYALRDDQAALRADTTGAPIEFVSGDGVATAIAFEPKTWTYNTFDFAVNAPSDGELLIRQVPDPRWRIAVDGRPVAYSPALHGLGIRLPLSSGQHSVVMDYRPFARAYYWPAAGLLLLQLLFLVVLTFRRPALLPNRASA